MNRNTFRTKGALLAAATVLSMGTFAVGGTVEAAASGCSGGLPSAGGTYTGSKCNTLTNGTRQRSKQWCPASGVGWQYGAWKGTAGVWSNTASCSVTPNSRDQEID